MEEKFNENKEAASLLTYKNIIFAIMLVLILLFLFNIADIAIMLFVAFIITCAIDPVINKLQTKMPRVLAVSLVLFLLLFSVLVIFIPLLNLTIEQGITFVKSLPQYFANINEFFGTNKIGMMISKYINTNMISSENLDIREITSNILEQGVHISKFIVNSITASIAVTIMVFYLSYDAKLFEQRFVEFFPPRFKNKACLILNSIKTKVGGYVFAQASSMAVIGVLTFLGLLIIGHKNALLIGFLACILDIIPVIGATIAVSIGLYTAISGGFLYVVLSFAVMIIAQWLQNQIARPILFGKFMDTHPLLIIVSLLIGAKFMGFWGVVLAPVMASIVCVLVDELYIKQINKKE